MVSFGICGLRWFNGIVNGCMLIDYGPCVWISSTMWMLTCMWVSVHMTWNLDNPIYRILDFAILNIALYRTVNNTIIGQDNDKWR